LKIVSQFGRCLADFGPRSTFDAAAAPVDPAWLR
jgi:hypothetical protein